MKKILLFLLLCMTTMVGYADVSQTTSRGSYLVVITKVVGRNTGHLAQPIDCPTVYYNLLQSQITIDFGDQLVSNYNITISSLYTDVDYYATSSYTTIPLVVDGYSDYTIIIETSDGDVFEGTLAASDYTTTATF